MVAASLKLARISVIPRAALCLTCWLHISKSCNRMWTPRGRPMGTDTFVKENHDLLKRLHEVDVVVTVLLDLLQEDQLWLALGAEHGQQGSVLLQEECELKTLTFLGGTGWTHLNHNSNLESCSENIQFLDYLLITLCRIKMISLSWHLISFLSVSLPKGDICELVMISAVLLCLSIG